MKANNFLILMIILLCISNLLRYASSKRDKVKNYQIKYYYYNDK